jgi:hypothetical protein
MISEVGAALGKLLDVLDGDTVFVEVGAALGKLVDALDENGHSYIKAAENGHLNILEYAISTVLRITDNQSFTLMDKASFFGHLEILKWFYPRINRNRAGRKIDYEIFFSSILGNQMHILE